MTARYARQILLPGIGPAGQDLLAQAHIAIVGLGALGCANADLLARAGVGRLTLIDRDVVEASNLQRQCLFSTHDARECLPKVEAGAVRLREVNPHVALRPLALDLTPASALDALALHATHDVPPPTIIIDGSDNFETRYLLNDIVVEHGLSLAYGGVVGTGGMSMLLRPHAGGPCLRCIFPDLPAPGSTPTCDTAGVLGPAVSIVAATQATEVLKVLLGLDARLAGSLLEFDLWSNKRRRLTPQRDSACPCCGRGERSFLRPLDASSPAATLCGQDAVQIHPRTGYSSVSLVSLDDLARRLEPLGVVRRSRLMLRFTPSSLLHDAPISVSVFPDGRAIIHGTPREDVARSLYARYIGS